MRYYHPQKQNTRLKKLNQLAWLSLRTGLIALSVMIGTVVVLYFLNIVWGFICIAIQALGA